MIGRMTTFPDFMAIENRSEYETREKNLQENIVILQV